MNVADQVEKISIEFIENVITAYYHKTLNNNNNTYKFIDCYL